MKIAVLSDTHDREDMVQRALAELSARGIRTVLHCGDIEGPDIVSCFSGWDAHFVLGNCDTDGAGLRGAMAASQVTLHEPFASLELEGVKIAFLHGHDKRLLQDVERSGYFDFLFYGHTHVAREHRTGPTRVINPGALHRARPKGFLVLDLASGETESVLLDPVGG